jgi:hypothetical protein
VLNIIFYADAMFLPKSEPLNSLRGAFSTLTVRAIHCKMWVVIYTFFEVFGSESLRE